jgi:hypothetical protein
MDEFITLSLPFDHPAIEIPDIAETQFDQGSGSNGTHGTRTAIQDYLGFFVLREC